MKLFIKTHGLSGSREYSIWENIKQRCLNPNNNRYYDYGGRGITLCKRWFKFKNFIKDMGRVPSNQHTIDRINNNGGYKPSNCRWATVSEQVVNKSNTIRIKYKGQVKLLTEWASETGVKPQTIRVRIIRGWSNERALTTPTRFHK